MAMQSSLRGRHPIFYVCAKPTALLQPQYTMQVFGQIFATIIYGNKLNTDVSGWGFLIASRQRLLQTVEQLHSDLIIVA